MKMKKLVVAATLLIAVAGGRAYAENQEEAVAAPTATQDSTQNQPKRGVWTTATSPALKFDENYYQNWSATGISQFAFIATFNGDYKYSNDIYVWDNIADLALGLYWQDLDGDETQKGINRFESLRKNDDKIDLTSTFSMRLKKAWNVNFIANMKSQFFDGYTYTATDESLISAFMSPGYLTTSLGFEHKRDNWNVALSFLTGKTTFVLDERVINEGQYYGVDCANGKHVYFGLGSYVKFYYKKDIAKNLNLYTRIELFYDYRKPSYHDDIALTSFGAWPDDTYADAGFFRRHGYGLLHDTDLDFELKLEYRFSSFLSAYFSTRLKYDSDFKGMQRIFGRDESSWQLFQGAGLQIYFNWKTPKEK